MGKSKEEKTIPKSTVFPGAGIILYRLCQRLGNMNCLFQSISNNTKFIKNVQLDSKMNQAKDLKNIINKKMGWRFTVSVKDVICIITSNMILCITQKGQLFYYRSRQYTIWKSFTVIIVKGDMIFHASRVNIHA